MAKRNIAPITFSIIIFVLSIIGYFLIHNYFKMQEVDGGTTFIEQVAENEDRDFKSIIRLAENSVVQIEAYDKRSEATTGSGFLFNEKGDILTNAHVIENSEYIYVRTANAHIYPAAIVNYSDETDVAVLRVPQLAGETFLPLEKEKFAETGDEVIALGSPHGFQNTVTLGIISGTERNFSLEGYTYENIYQISAPITYGNSGGPLINRDNGFIIGMNSVGSEDGTIGFSIPIIEIIDDVEKWSASIHNEDLEFPLTEDILQFDEEELREDANYLVDYYFEGIQIRDFISSYALLGNELQDEMSYSEFREIYVHTTSIDFDIQDTVILDDQMAETIAKVSLEQKLPNKDDMEKLEYEYTFTISYENDQVKIIDYSYNKQ
ncbi:MAG TPA: S1C family serine protease [Bacillota bacterium]|nr:S1C family serine protease [Bacillota bacterium]